MAHTIYLAGGCFWGVQAYFQKIQGITHTQVGYANGTSPDPTYRQVCQGDTGYTETVKIEFDETIISLRDILRHFFRIVDPFTLNRQGNDVGTQYRSGIYSLNDEDLQQVGAFLAQQQAQFTEKFVLENQKLINFYPAEAYHQDYLLKQPLGYCHVDLRLADVPLPDENLR